MILNRNADNELTSVPLAQVNDTGAYIVHNVSGPELQRHRLSEIGIIAGARVSVVTCSRGMRVIKVGESRMALSPGTTEHIWLHPQKG